MIDNWGRRSVVAVGVVGVRLVAEVERDRMRSGWRCRRCRRRMGRGVVVVSFFPIAAVDLVTIVRIQGDKIALGFERQKPLPPYGFD
jgi:hypothetical protein